VSLRLLIPYCIKGSPINESPLGLFGAEDAVILEEDFGIPKRYLNTIMSPWAAKRLREFGGDISHSNSRRELQRY